jgi:Flp pilus assembly protein TadB
MSEPIHVHVQGGTQPPPGSGGGPGGGIGTLLLLPGLFFIGLGIAVLVVPALLKVLVAAAFIIVGLTLCLGGLRMRKMGQRMAMFSQGFPRQFP